MIKNICILDYGLGNILSLKNAITYLGYRNYFYSDTTKKNFDCLIIPGVGSFAKAMSLINQKGYEKIISEAKDNNVLILGICLGMQLMFETGYEEGESKGLSLLKGEIKQIDKKIQPILPHIGWKRTKFLKEEKKSFFSKYDNQKFYYVHSYEAKLKNDYNALATSAYNEYEFIAGVKDKNLIGLQFHPEKSGEVGLELIKDMFRNY